MQFVDAHLDLACIHLEGQDVRCEPTDAARQCVSLPGLRAAGVKCAFATIFTELGEKAASKPIGYVSSADVVGAERAGLRQLHLYHWWERERELAILRTGADLLPLQDTGGHAARGTPPIPHIVLLMEGADPIRDPSHLPFWVEQGVRIVGLTWANGSRYATGNAVEAGNTRGLSPMGREMVRELDRLGVIHDVSHLSDAAFDEVASLAGGPVIASHSNPRALMDDRQRHITDAQIRFVASRNGVVGLNLYSKFLAIDRRATVNDCVRAVEHVCEVMGHRGGVGLGSDMDGGFTPGDLPIDLDHPGKLGNLLLALRSAGWSEHDVAGFAAANWLRFLCRSLRG